jgi:phage-related baseplate assembly protein
LTDIVDVVKPEEVEYSIELTYYTTFKDANEVITNVEGPGGAIDQYKDWQCSCIGYDINPDELRKRILSPGEGLTGANRVIVTKPEYVELNDTQVAKCTGVKVTHVTQDKF